VNELFEAKNFEDVIVNSNKVIGKLKLLECFKTVEVLIDTSHGLDSTPEGVEVNILYFFYLLIMSLKLYAFTILSLNKILSHYYYFSGNI
jgi:hypothetical protein